MIKYFLIAILIGIGHSLYSQSGTIYGVVKDSIDEVPLEYTTIMLYKTKDSTAIGGTISANSGAFKIEAIPPGNYYLRLSFLGYKSKEINNINIDEANIDINLETVLIQSTQAFLNEVEIDGSRPSIDYKIDKKVITVNKQLADQSGSAIDILENLASIQVDINGDVRLRGSKGLTVLIDGTPTLLSPSEALRQIPAKTIANIEIITNPSAKFDSEGSAGIINIISRKDKLAGLTAYINLIGGNYNRYGGDFLLSYKQVKYNVYFGADFNNRGLPELQSSDRTTIDRDTTFRTIANGNNTNDRTTTSLKTGVEFNASKHDILNLELKYTHWNNERTSELNIEEWTVPSESTAFSTNFSNQNPGGDIFALRSFYKRLFAKSGHQIKASFSYDYQNAEDNPVNELKNPENEIIDGKKNFEAGTANLFRLKVDYDLPIGKDGKLQAGLQSNFQLYHDDTGLDIYDTEINEYEVDSNFTQSTDYTRNIQSIYALYSSKIKHFDYQVGIRGEYTDRIIDNSSNTDLFNYNRFNLFPSLHLSYEFPKKNQIFASYSRRIDRPRSSWLEPFFTWRDAFNIRRGNPELIPEIVDSYELGFIKKFNKNAVSLESYYRVSHNKIEQVDLVFEENILLLTRQNVDQDFSLGFEFSLDYKLFDWWRFELLGNFFNYRVEGNIGGIDFSNENNSWSSRFNNTFSFYKHTQLQISSMYNGPIVDVQGKYNGYYRLNAAIRQDLFNNKLSVTFRIVDIFSSVKREYNGEGPRFNSQFITQRNAPRFTVSVSYNFEND